MVISVLFIKQCLTFAVDDVRDDLVAFCILTAKINVSVSTPPVSYHIFSLLNFFSLIY